MSSPVFVARSTVVVGAATRNGIPASAQARATPTVPTLFAVSPFAAIRSAPTIAASTSPLRMVPAAAPSAWT